MAALAYDACLQIWQIEPKFSIPTFVIQRLMVNSLVALWFLMRTGDGRNIESSLLLGWEVSNLLGLRHVAQAKRTIGLLRLSVGPL